MTASVLDNSAFARLASPRLPDHRRREIADALNAGLVQVCLPFLLEVGYSARSELIDELLALPRAWLTDAVEERALSAQAQLARAGDHRLPPVDVLIAAIADVHELDVLHYDADFDVIASHTDLRFGSQWLAPRGSL